MNRNRRIGHQYERDCAKIMRGLGWKDCKTSRYSNRELDDLGVDLTNTDPYLIQNKVSAKCVNYRKILSSMPDGKKLIFNKIITNKKKKGEYVIMEIDTLFSLLG